MAFQPADSTVCTRRPLVGSIALVLGVLLCWVCALPAGAAQSYETGGMFAQGAFAEPTDLAFDQAAGMVLVVDAAANQVEIYDPGSPGAPIGSFGSGELASPYGIAVDQASGAVYVTDSGNSRIVRFESDGADPPAYSLDTGYTSPGTDWVVNFKSPIAVDPSSGNLVLADTGANRVTTFDPSGSFVSTFSGIWPNTFNSLWDVAADQNGDVWVVANGTFDGFGGTKSGSTVVRFGPAGEEKEALPGLGEATAVAVGPTPGVVLVATGGGALSFGSGTPVRLHVFNDGVPVGAPSFPGSEESRTLGLAVDTSEPGHAYGLTGVSSGFGSGQTGVAEFAGLSLPDVRMDAPSVTDPTSVQLTGTVDPLGEPAEAYFEYSGDGGETWSQTPVTDMGTGEGPLPIAAALSDLVGPTFQFRLVATNADGVIRTPAQSGRMLYAETLAAAEVKPGSAVLQAKAYPEGRPTSYRFEYGADESYGQATPNLAIGTGSTSIARTIEGLAPGVTYHFRIVVENSLGVFHGVDRVFTTPVAPVAQRAYEQVSPVQKNGIEVTIPTVYISPKISVGGNGDSVAYQTDGSFGDAPASTKNQLYLGQRTPAGWESRTMEVPQLHAADEFAIRFGGTLAVSADLSHSMVTSRRALTSDAIEGAYNAYRRDNRTGALEHIYSAPNEPTFWSNGDVGDSVGYGVLTGTPDFSHIVFGESQALTSDAPDNGLAKVYEFTGGELRLVSVMPDGEPATETAVVASSLPLVTNSAISDDGSKIFFSIGQDSANLGAIGLFVREDGEKTVPISVSQRPGDGNDPQPALFFGASADGSVVYFTSTSPLTTDASSYAPSYDLKGDLYRYELETGDLIDLTPDMSAIYPENTEGARLYVEPVRGISSDGGRVYFLSFARLTADAAAGPWHVYLWDEEGGLRLVHEEANPTPFDLYPLTVEISPDSRYAAFATPLQFSAYDSTNMLRCNESTTNGHPNNRCQQIYLYDTRDESLDCVSCNFPGGSAGDASMGTDTSVLDDGRVFFNSPDPLGPADVNAAIDVYEWRGGEQVLLSSGRSDTASAFLGASVDGRDVFFATRDRLVGQDADNLSDLYDAREGGGLPAQNPMSPPSDCAGADCLAAPGPRPAIAAPGTAAAHGPGNRRAARACKGKGRAKARKKQRRSKKSQAAMRSAKAKKRQCGRGNGK